MRLVGCYVALGDSFSAGISGHVPWPDLAAVKLQESSPRLRFRNLAAAGATSHEVAAEQLGPALALRPDLISLICGANDVLLCVRPDEDGFARTLDAMLRRIGTAAPAALVVTATYPPSVPDRLRRRTRRRVLEGIARFNAAIRQVSRANGALCLDWQEHAEVGSHQNFATDGLHPSRRGHRVAAAGFIEAVSLALAPETATEVA